MLSVKLKILYVPFDCDRRGSNPTHKSGLQSACINIMCIAVNGADGGVEAETGAMVELDAGTVG